MFFNVVTALSCVLQFEAHEETFFFLLFTRFQKDDFGVSARTRIYIYIRTRYLNVGIFVSAAVLV